MASDPSELVRKCIQLIENDLALLERVTIYKGEAIAPLDKDTADKVMGYIETLSKYAPKEENVDAKSNAELEDLVLREAERIRISRGGLTSG